MIAILLRCRIERVGLRWRLVAVGGLGRAGVTVVVVRLLGTRMKQRFLSVRLSVRTGSDSGGTRETGERDTRIVPLGRVGS